MVPPAEARGRPGGAGGVAGADRDGRDSVRKVHGEVVGYFENHVHRMDYPLPGQGLGDRLRPEESACKTVIGKRMKDGGMRGARTEPTRCHLRALFASGEKQWDAYWHPSQN